MSYFAFITNLLNCIFALFSIVNCTKKEIEQ